MFYTDGLDWREPRNTARLDWKERLLSGRHLIPELLLFADQAACALRVLKRLRIRDIHGTPNAREGPARSGFSRFVEALFGSYDVTTDRRMIQELFLLARARAA
jgi:phage terminase large subunit-like protein